MASPINANTEIYDKAVDRAAMVRLYERRVNGKADTILDSHIVRVDDIVKGSSTSVKGQKDLFFELSREHAKAYQELHSTSGSSLLDLYTDQSNYTHSTLSEVFGSIWRVEKSPVRLAEEVVLQRPLYNDQTLAQGWGTIGVNARKRIEAVIRKGIAEGDTINDIAKAVTNGSAHKITRTQAHGLVVTAVTSVTAQADFAIYEANSKAIQGWQYVAILDARTTYVCRIRNGKIFTLEQRSMLPPAHYHCRSKTVPVFKKWDDIAANEGLSQVRQRNLKNLSDEEKAYYDGETPLREPYNDWLMRQPKDVQLRHLGDYKKVELFNQGQLEVERFSNPEGNTIGIRELRAMTNPVVDGDTRRFAAAKQQLDAMRLGISSPDDLIDDKKLQQTLKDYYLLQNGELDGTLSLTNYRGNLIHTKKAMKNRVLMNPPTEDQLKFNPITGRYDDVRLFQPNPAVLENNLRLVAESTELLDRDKEFITNFIDGLDMSMGMNERAVVTDNLRILFTRYRKKPEVWVNFKALTQAQMKFDVMNVSDYIETQIRRDTNVLKKLLDSNYIDPVLGPVQLNNLHDNFTKNIIAKNLWEDRTAPTIAKELKGIFNPTIAKAHPTIWTRLSDRELQQFYLKFAQRLALADTPDKDQLAVQLGRDLFNLANYNGTRREWYELGNSILESKRVHKFFELETFGVQKRRMKSRMGGKYFGPYYDTLSYNIRITDPRIQKYAKLTREVELGLRVAVTEDKNRLLIREGYKTYFIDRGVLGLEDTRIPITSTTSFGDFPVDLVDSNMVKALNWAGQTKYRIDEDYYDFIKRLLYFEDDRGAAQHYNELNEYKKYIVSRSDSYERFKTMEWLRGNGKAFSNHPFLDHRARIYDRGLISPQSGETFRPFLNTEVVRNFSPEDFANFSDQVGSFLGGASDALEGRYNSLTFPGRQKIAEKWRPELVKLGNHMLRGKPADMRAILESKMAAEFDGEELGKFYRLALESAKIDNYLGGDYSAKSLLKLNNYRTALALEQDASSSGAQIIALTTRNKQLAELSNVIPTMQKKRLYDEIAAATFNDPRFKELNKKLGLSEKDLRKAAKA